MPVRLASALLAAAAIAVFLAACGGSRDGSTASTDSTTAGSTTAESGRTRTSTSTGTGGYATEAPASKSSNGGESGGRGKSQGAASGKNSTPPRSTSSEATDPPTPGFHDTSGQTHIPAFGVEASASTRADVQNVLNAYLQASSEGEWSKACGYLYGTLLAEISEFAESSGQNADTSCATALPRVLKLSAGGKDPYLGAANLSGLRIKEGAGAGFAIFHGTDGNDYWVAMKVDGSKWLILTAAPQPLH